MLFAIAAAKTITRRAFSGSFFLVLLFSGLLACVSVRGAAAPAIRFIAAENAAAKNGRKMAMMMTAATVVGASSSPFSRCLFCVFDAVVLTRAQPWLARVLLFFFALPPLGTVLFRSLLGAFRGEPWGR